MNRLARNLAVLAVFAMPAAVYATRTEDALRAAERLAWEKRFADAEQQYRDILRREPRSRAAELGLGQVLLWEQRYADAAMVYARRLHDAPDDVDARKGVATAAYWSGDFRTAQREYSAVVRARPGDAEARKALADIGAASSPLFASDNDFVNDDQPMRRMRAAVAYTAFSDPLTKWTASAGSYALTARGFSGAASPFVSIAATTSLPSMHLRASASMRLFRFPDGATKLLGGFELARMWNGSEFRAEVNRQELLYTASSLSAHPSETTATLGWNRDSDAASSSAALHTIRYFDGNSGRAADAYQLLRVAHGARGSLSAGAAVSYRDTAKSRLIFDGAAQRYDPYWTPQDLMEVRAVVSAALPAGRTTVHLHADGGWAHDCDSGIGRTFHPWRASADAAFPLRGAMNAVIGIEHQSTVFYSADSIHFGFSGRL
jgi:tetratricopeptide (TPR) repeat protein